MFWWLTILIAKNFFLVPNLNLPSFSLKPLPLVLSLHALVKSPSPALLQAHFRYWKAAVRSPQSLLFSRLNNPNSLNLSSQAPPRPATSPPSPGDREYLWTHMSSSVCYSLPQPALSSHLLHPRSSESSGFTPKLEVKGTDNARSNSQVQAIRRYISQSSPMQQNRLPSTSSMQIKSLDLEPGALLLPALP